MGYNYFEIPNLEGEDIWWTSMVENLGCITSVLQRCRGFHTSPSLCWLWKFAWKKAICVFWRKALSRLSWLRILLLMSFIWQVCFGMQLVDFILKLSWCTTSLSSLNLLLQKLTTSLSFSRCVMSLWNRFKDHGGRDKTNMLLVDSGPANLRAF